MRLEMLVGECHFFADVIDECGDLRDHRPQCRQVVDAPHLIEFAVSRHNAVNLACPIRYERSSDASEISLRARSRA